jgi:hypothetical protein
MGSMGVNPVLEFTVTGLDPGTSKRGLDPGIAIP